MNLILSLILGLSVLWTPLALAQGEMRVRESGGTDYVGFKAPASIPAILLWTLPATDGGANQCLATDGSGGLIWQDAGSGDFMADGSVTMTGNLQTGSNWISNDGANEGLFVDTVGKVGIGTTGPRTALDVNGSISSAPSALNATATIDFAGGNIQHTDSDCGTFDLHNLKDGTAYTFVVKGGTSATCSFNVYSDAGSTALTMHLPPGHGATTASTHTVYTLLVSGGDVYASWIPGY